MRTQLLGNTMLSSMGLALVLVLAQSAAAAEPASQPAAGGLDPRIEQVLDRLEKKGGTVKDIVADLTYTKQDTVLDSKQVLTGKIKFMEAVPNPRFLVEFDKINHDGAISDKKEWYAFDDRWYIEARQSTQSINKRELIPPGSKENIFRLGEGPFPLPFGQKKAEIVKHFTLKLVPPLPKDPLNTDHLECTPRPGSKLARQYDTVHFYVDRKLDLPVKMTTVQKEDDQSITAEFRNLKPNTGMAGSELNLPNLPNYRIHEDRLADSKSDK